MKKILFTIFFLSVFGVAHADITTGLQGHWTFDEGSGTTAADSSGNGYTATSMYASGGGTMSWIAGKIGAGAVTVSGNGTTPWFAVGDQTNLKITGNITLSAWVKFTTSQSNRPILAKWGTTGAYALFVDFTSANKFKMDVFTGSVGKVAASVNTYNDGNWHMVTGVYDGAHVILYVDGNAEIVTGDAYAGTINNSTEQVTIGDYNTNSAAGFIGSMDDACIYNRALTAADVLQLFNSTGGCGASVTVIIDRLIIWAQTFINGALFIN